MTRLEARLIGEIARLSRVWSLIEPDDHILVAISGGKDSWAMLHLLERLRGRVPFTFTMTAVNLDQGHPGFPADVIRRWLDQHGFRHHLVAVDTLSVVLEKLTPGSTQCSLCSRLRRGILYTTAQTLGCNKIALGHHRDDAIETLLLNQLYAGQTKSMPPRLRSDDGRNVVIRPLLACDEADLAEYAAEIGAPIIPCDLCGSQENLRRKRVKRLIAELSAENNHVRSNLFAALANVRPSHLMDRDLITSGPHGDGPGEAFLDEASL
jgi:tRNA 2-thiocytidine biosynthesis protein TtcA